MACPYFCPSEPLPWRLWQGKLRPPLGEAHAGECRARQGEPFAPSGALLLESCNLGYASKTCERFPEGGSPDAVRFCVVSDEGEVVRITYVIEKAHLPDRHGSVEYDRSRHLWTGVETGTVLHRQAEAYLNSYLRWKEQSIRTQELKTHD